MGISKEDLSEDLFDIKYLKLLRKLPVQRGLLLNKMIT